MTGLAGLAQRVELLRQLLTLRAVQIRGSGLAKQTVERALFTRQRLPAQLKGNVGHQQAKGRNLIDGWLGALRQSGRDRKNLSSAAQPAPVLADVDINGSTPRVSGSLPNWMKSSEVVRSGSGC